MNHENAHERGDLNHGYGYEDAYACQYHAGHVHASDSISCHPVLYEHVCRHEFQNLLEILFFSPSAMFLFLQ